MTATRGATSGVLAVAGVLLLAASMRAGIAGVPPVLDDLGLQSAAKSLLVTIPVVCFGLGALAGPALRAAIGEERALFAVLVLLLAGLLVRAAWPESWLFPGTILAGLGIAGINVLLPSLIRHRFRAHAGAMTAAYTTALGVGAALTAGVAVPVLQATDSIEAALAVAVPPAALALLAWLPQLRAGRGHVRRRRRRTPGGRSVWRQPLAWQVTLFMGLQSVLYYGPLSWLPSIYRDHGVDAAAAGLLLMVMQLLSIVGSTIAPLLATRSRDQRPAIAGALALISAGALGLLVAPTVAPALWAVLLGIGQGAAFSLALLVIVLRAADGDTAADLSSMAQFGGYAIATIGPLTMGLLHGATGGWTAPLALLMVVAAVALAAGLASGRDRLVGAR
ncbi:MAG: MFS transporter [Solirubrobacteraceae bacterium]